MVRVYSQPNYFHLRFSVQLQMCRLLFGHLNILFHIVYAQKWVDLQLLPRHAIGAGVTQIGIFKTCYFGEGDRGRDGERWK